MSAREKRKLLNLASTDMFFSTEQASTLVDCIAPPGADQDGVKLDAVYKYDHMLFICSHPPFHLTPGVYVAAYSLLPRLVDPENSSDLIKEHLSDNEQRKLA